MRVLDSEMDALEDKSLVVEVGYERISAWYINGWKLAGLLPRC